MKRESQQNLDRPATILKVLGRYDRLYRKRIEVGPARHWKLWATVDMSPLGVRCTARAEGPPVIDITFAGDLERLDEVPHYPSGYEWMPAGILRLRKAWKEGTQW